MFYVAVIKPLHFVAKITVESVVTLYNNRLLHHYFLHITKNSINRKLFEDSFSGSIIAIVLTVNICICKHKLPPQQIEIEVECEQTIG